MILETFGGLVDELVELAVDLTGQYANANDPWWADTIVGSRELTSELPPEELGRITGSLQRLGLKLDLRDDIAADQVLVERRDWGPWPEDADVGEAVKSNKRSRRKRSLSLR